MGFKISLEVYDNHFQKKLDKKIFRDLSYMSAWNCPFLLTEQYYHTIDVHLSPQTKEPFVTFTICVTI